MSEQDVIAYRKLKADPVRYAAMLERRRKQRARRQAVNGYETQRKRNWRTANRERDRLLHKAHHAVELSLKSGKLIRPSTCAHCGCGGKIEAHHFLGYEQEHWLDILWLCETCHHAEHAKV